MEAVDDDVVVEALGAIPDAVRKDVELCQFAYICDQSRIVVFMRVNRRKYCLQNCGVARFLFCFLV